MIDLLKILFKEIIVFDIGPNDIVIQLKEFKNYYNTLTDGRFNKDFIHYIKEWIDDKDLFNSDLKWMSQDYLVAYNYIATFEKDDIDYNILQEHVEIWKGTKFC